MFAELATMILFLWDYFQGSSMKLITPPENFAACGIGAAKEQTGCIEHCNTYSITLLWHAT